MYLLNWFRKYKNVFDDPSKRLLKIEIDSEALSNNVSRFRTLFPRHYLGVVLKSNAYGHGLKEMGKLLDKNKEVDCFVVDSLVEAKTLRDNGIKKPVIILGYIPQNALRQLKKIKDVILIVNSKEQAFILKNKINFKLKVHIKVDTGMNRHGIPVSDLVAVIEILRSNKKISIEGMMSHLADADGLSGVSTQMQIQQWRAALAIYRKIIGHRKGIFHFAATAGSRYSGMAENNLIRAGIGVYGFDNTQDNRLKVLPVLSFWSKIANIKKIKKGERVGYNFTYIAPKDMTIAVVPCGYYEGIPRSLSNIGYFYYKNIPLPIIGMISMNLTVVDISDIKEPIYLEDEIEIYSADLNKLNSVGKVAKLCNTIPYEILVRLAPTIKRVIR